MTLQPEYKFTQGDFEITVLSDGFLTIPGEILVPHGTDEQRAAVLARVDSVDGMVRPKTNIPVVRKGADLIVVDIGAGDKYQPSDGKLTENMKRANVDPTSVTKVVFTHAHPDHIWATLKEDESPRFPNATYYVGAVEWDFWMDPKTSPICPQRCMISPRARSETSAQSKSARSCSSRATRLSLVCELWTRPAIRRDTSRSNSMAKAEGC